MITFETKQYVPGVTAHAAYRFLTTLEDRDYRTWWPGVHLRAISRRRTPDLVGSVLYMDQYLGPYRVQSTETIVAATPDEMFLRQVTLLGVRVPVRMLFEFEEDDRGVLITHTLKAGLPGLGRIFDPAFRLYFHARFLAAIDRHVQDELAIMGRRIAAHRRQTGLPPLLLPSQYLPDGSFARL